VNRLAATVVGALSEAWAELRHHRLRVLLSLVGIAVSVGALTAVVALADYQRQFTAEQSDRYGGRAATITVSISGENGATVDPDASDAQFARIADRYGFDQVSRVAEGLSVPVETPEGFRPTSLRLIDPAYSVMHRLPIAEGRWFVPADADLLAAPVVISGALWEALGSVPLAQHPSLVLGDPLAGSYPIVGVTPRQGPWDTEKRVDLLYGDYRERVDAMGTDVSVRREVWVPPTLAAEIGPVLAMDLRQAAGADAVVNVGRSDWAAQPGATDSALVFELVTGAIAGLVLLLGGLSLVNIQLVAMRQRIREIGVRRSFGASGGRVFSAVLLESVVATAVAGAVGILLVIVLARSPLVLTMFPGMQDVPPFPMRAALIGLAASVVIGALAGLLPALVALRVKVIDTLRF
jgi:putative ABC transport system permease protein